MDIEVSSSSSSSSPVSSASVNLEERSKKAEVKDQVRVRRKTLQVVLQQCQRALELLSTTDGVDDDGDSSGADSREVESSPSRDSSSSSLGDREVDEVYFIIIVINFGFSFQN